MDSGKDVTSCEHGQPSGLDDLRRLRGSATLSQPARKTSACFDWIARLFGPNDEPRSDDKLSRLGRYGEGAPETDAADEEVKHLPTGLVVTGVEPPSDYHLAALGAAVFAKMPRGPRKDRAAANSEALYLFIRQKHKVTTADESTLNNPHTLQSTAPAASPSMVAAEKTQSPAMPQPVEDRNQPRQQKQLPAKANHDLQVDIVLPEALGTELRCGRGLETEEVSDHISRVVSVFPCPELSEEEKRNRNRPSGVPMPPHHIRELLAHSLLPCTKLLSVWPLPGNTGAKISSTTVRRAFPHPDTGSGAPPLPAKLGVSEAEESVVESADAEVARPLVLRIQQAMKAYLAAADTERIGPNKCLLMAGLELEDGSQHLSPPCLFPNPWPSGPSGPSGPSPSDDELEQGFNDPVVALGKHLGTFAGANYLAVIEGTGRLVAPTGAAREYLSYQRDLKQLRLLLDSDNGLISYNLVEALRI